MNSLRSRRLWGGIFAVLVVIEAIWLIGANWALSSPWVIGQINAKPDRLQVKWASARTMIPGFIQLEGLSVRGQSKKQQWYVELADGRVHMSLLALAFKSFRTYSFKGSALDFRLRKRQLPEEPPMQSAAFAPGIPGLAADEPPFSPKMKKAKDIKPWKIVLHDIHIDGIEQLWILAIRLAAVGEIDADLTIELGGGALSMDRVHMDLSDAELTAMGNPVMRDMDLGIDIQMDPFLPKEAKGFAILKSLSGTVTLAGESKGAGIINSLLTNFESVEVGSPGGQLDGTIQIQKGILAPGTELSFAAADGWVDVLDWRTTGKLQLASAVSAVAGEISSEVHLTLAEVTLTDRTGGEALLDGASLGLDAIAGEVDASGGTAAMSASLEAISLDLVNAHVADLARFPIPAVEDFALVGGEILVESHAVLTRDDGGEATIDVRGEGIDASYGEIEMKGNLTIDLDVATDDVTDRRFDFTDSRFVIDEVRINDGKKVEEDWYFQLDMTEGWLQLKDPGLIFTSARIQMKDTRPLIVLLGQEKNIFNKLKGLLNFEDLEAVADLEVAANRLEIEDFDIDSEGLKLKANLQIKDKKAAGILYTKFHGIPIAVDLRGEKKDLVLLRPLKWYEEQTVPWAGHP